jgi:molybdate transport system substrate-binding protein
MIELTRRGLKTCVLALALSGLALANPAFAENPSPAANAPGAAATKGPVIFAAASMKTALDAIAAAWTARNGGAPSISYAASPVLAKQIEQGAPADIFVSADLQWMDYLDKAKHIRPGTRRNLLGNSLVLIEPADGKSELKIEPGFNLAGAVGDGKLAVCTITSCPGGVYAKEALEKLGIFAALEPKLAQADNIRNALALVARGEAPFGIVYLTDAKAEPKVRVVGTFPEETHSPIIYPVAITAESKHKDAAQFIAYLSSQEATKILTGQGFKILKK